MALERPAPGSHDRGVPSGTLEESAAALFEAMLAARDAEERGGDDGTALRGFYRALMSGILLHSGIGKGLYTAVARWVAFLPGGLAVASIFSCAIFAAISVRSRT